MKKHILKVWMILAISFLAMNVAGQGPVVSSFIPADNSPSVGLDNLLTIVFDQSIEFGAGPSEIRIRNYTDDTVFETFLVYGQFTSSSLSVSGNELRIGHTTFEENTQYYIEIQSGAVQSLGDVAFPGISDKDFWNFTTEILPSAPVVSSLIPADNSPSVGLDNLLTIVFDQSIEFGAGPCEIRIRNYTDDSVFETFLVYGQFTSSSLSVSGNELSIGHTAFAENTQYYVEIESGAVQSLDDIAFSGISNKDIWNFTTLIPVDPPAVAENGYSPIPGATEVSLNPVLELTFTENIVKGNSGYFRIFKSVGGVDDELLAIPRSNGQVSVLNNKLSVTLSSITLEYNTDYYILIDAGFIKSETTGVDFGGISNSSEWNFKTETAPPVWAAGYPLIQNQNPSTFDLVGQVDQTGTFYYVVADENSLLDHSIIYTAAISGGNGGFQLAGNGATTANVDFIAASLSTTPLEYGQDYYLFVYTASGNKNSEIIRLDIDRIIPRLRVQGTYPSAGFSVMPVNDAIVLNFSEKLYVVDNDILVEITEANARNYIKLFKDEGVDPIAVTYTISTDGKEHTLSPSAVLDENASYKVVIGTVSDEFGNMATIPDHTFSTDKQQEWTGGGTNPNDWSEDANWSTGTFTSGKSVTIPSDAISFPEISLSTDVVNVHNLTIEPGAALTHTAGTLNLTGLLHLQSSPEVNATYLNNGGTLIAEPNQIRIDQVVSYSDRTYHIGSPVNGATRLSIGATRVVYAFNNLAGAWEDNGNNPLDFGVGYATRSSNDLVFTGSLNFTSFFHTVTRSPAGFGWNLIGNPYTATLDFSNMITDEIEPAFWIWQNDQGIYGTMNFDADLFVNLESDLIPSNHSFFIKVKIGFESTDIKFDPAYLVNNEVSYLKSSRKSNVDHIKLAAVSGSVEDEVAIGFIENSSASIDRFDSEKYLGRSSNVLELFSLVGNNRLAINCQPSASSTTIPLGYSTVTPGTYKIKLSANSMDGSRLFLRDAELNVTQELNLGDSYEFNIETAGANTSRFSLMVERVITDLNSPVFEESELTVFSQNRNIILVVNEDFVGASYIITDMAGRNLKSGVIDGIGEKNLGQVSRGSYVLQVHNNKVSLLKRQKVVVY